jgi:hypothetical protein
MSTRSSRSRRSRQPLGRCLRGSLPSGAREEPKWPERAHLNGRPDGARRPPGTARHIVPTQHPVRAASPCPTGRDGLRYWAGVSSPHLRCGTGVGRAGVRYWAGVSLREHDPDLLLRRVLLTRHAADRAWQLPRSLSSRPSRLPLRCTRAEKCLLANRSDCPIWSDDIQCAGENARLVIRCVQTGLVLRFRQAHQYRSMPYQSSGLSFQIQAGVGGSAGRSIHTG